MRTTRYGPWRAVCHLVMATLAMTAAMTAALAGAAPAKLVLAFGDSLTAGYGLGPGDGFAPQLEAALRAQGVNAVVHNAGVSGDTTAQGRARLEWVLKGLHATPDLAIVELGANDMLRGEPPAAAKANLDAILTTLGRHSIPVLVAGMRAAPNLGPAYGREFDAIFPAVAHAHDAMLYPFFMAGVAGTPGLQLADGLHPTKAGVAAIVKRITPTVVAALRR